MRCINSRNLLNILISFAIIVSLGFISASNIWADDLPQAPDWIKKKGVLRVGTKCDYPPDGFIDKNGKVQGIEVALARQIGKYLFGEDGKTEIVCVTAANRVPSLVGGKIDLVIATMGINAKRKEILDFTEPYAWGASSVMVLKDSDIKKLADLKGRTVVVIKGGWQIPWFEKQLPEAKLLKLDSVSDALQALLQGRADAYGHDFDVHSPIAARNPKVRVLDEYYMLGNRGAGVRKGEAKWLAYVNAAINKAKADGLIKQWIDKYANPELKDTLIKAWDMSLYPKK